MTKSISRSQVRLITSTNTIFGADEACAMLRISRDAMYRLAKDPDDPFPIRYIAGKTRDGIVLHDELVAWVERNSVVGSPRGTSADGGRRPEGTRRPLPARVSRAPSRDRTRGFC